ncbi:MAG TPA: T9SS C-terminal target domain-containing protein, partial [Flavobacterium sp.]
MNKLYSLLIAVAGCSLNAQNITIPDANFKSMLVQANYTNSYVTDANDIPIVLDTNSDGEIQVSEAVNVYGLNIVNAGISSLEGLTNFPNLKNLECSGNPLTTLDLSGLPNIEVVYCSNAQLSSLDISNINSLLYLECNFNQISSLNVANSNLVYLYAQNNLLQVIDLTG